VLFGAGEQRVYREPFGWMSEPHPKSLSGWAEYRLILTVASLQLVAEKRLKRQFCTRAQPRVLRKVTHRDLGIADRGGRS
jgi:hypothetical protein